MSTQLTLRLLQITLRLVEFVDPINFSTRWGIIYFSVGGLLCGVIISMYTAFTITTKYESQQSLITGSSRMRYAMKSTLTVSLGNSAF
jgi:hypothetical protein